MDFLLTDNLDLKIEDGIIGTQIDGETTMLQAFFTDARVKQHSCFTINLCSNNSIFYF
jgi:hypothetical protein